MSIASIPCYSCCILEQSTVAVEIAPDNLVSQSCKHLLSP